LKKSNRSSQNRRQNVGRGAGGRQLGDHPVGDLALEGDHLIVAHEAGATNSPKGNEKSVQLKELNKRYPPPQISRSEEKGESGPPEGAVLNLGKKNFGGNR